MHPSYYYRAHACVLVFDVTRKATYKNLTDWYGELRQYCEGIPCLLVANKIDVDYNVREGERVCMYICRGGCRVLAIVSRSLFFCGPWVSPIVGGWALFKRRRGVYLNE